MDVLDLWYSGYFLFIAVEKLWKRQEDKAAQPRGNKKEELVNSLANNNVVEIEELKEQAGTVDNPEDVADLIKKYEEILKLKRQGIISVAYHQGKVFSRFREKEKFVRLVANFGVHKGTIIFKINLLWLTNREVITPDFLECSSN